LNSSSSISYTNAEGCAVTAAAYYYSCNAAATGLYATGGGG
jgi:hypothetical protein